MGERNQRRRGGVNPSWAQFSPQLRWGTAPGSGSDEGTGNVFSQHKNNAWRHTPCPAQPPHFHVTSTTTQTQRTPLHRTSPREMDRSIDGSIATHLLSPPHLLLVRFPPGLGLLGDGPPSVLLLLQSPLRVLHRLDLSLLPLALLALLVVRSFFRFAHTEEGVRAINNGYTKYQVLPYGYPSRCFLAE